MIRYVLTVLALAIFLPASAHAHFQMIYTPEIALDKGGEMTFKLVFTHPFDAGHTMNMGKPQEFYVISQRGEAAEPKKTDLMEYVTEIEWTSNNKAVAFEAKLPKQIVRSMGDYVFVLIPEPYLEKEEDIYIQQITKVVLNVGGVPGNWNTPLGLPTEVLPYDKPYANWTGGVFRGQILAGGKPVPNADLEIEYLNHAVDMDGNAFAKEGYVAAPHDSMVTMGINADADGEFTIGLARAGWWGVCALGSGPETEYNGKELSQDAVLWAKAVDMK